MASVFGRALDLRTEHSGAVEAPRDKAKSKKLYHQLFGTWTQDPQLMPTSMPGGSEVRYISEGWKKIYSNIDSTIMLSLM